MLILNTSVGSVSGIMLHFDSRIVGIVGTKKENNTNNDDALNYKSEARDLIYAL